MQALGSMTSRWGALSPKCIYFLKILLKGRATESENIETRRFAISLTKKLQQPELCQTKPRTKTPILFYMSDRGPGSLGIYLLPIGALAGRQIEAEHLGLKVVLWYGMLVLQPEA